MSTRTPLLVTLPDASGLRVAPERSALAVLDVGLAVAEHALHAEHPTLDELFDEPYNRIPPTLLAAYLVVRRCRELRELLASYQAALADTLDGEPADYDCLPF